MIPIFSFIFFLVSIFCVYAAPAQAEGARLPTVEVFEVMDDRRLVVFLHPDDIASNPKWEPGAGAPPLSIGDAIELAHGWIAQDSRLEGAKIREIELKPIHGHEREHSWYYLFQLRIPDARQTFYGAVLLNGEVVPVIAMPEATK